MQEPGSSVDTDRGRWNAAVAVGDEKTGPREERYAEYSIILAGETDAVSVELRATTRYTSFKLLHRAAKLSLGAAVRPLSVVRYGDCLRNRLRVAERRAPQLNAWLNALLLQPRGRLLVRSFMQFDVIAQRNLRPAPRAAHPRVRHCVKTAPRRQKSDMLDIYALILVLSPCTMTPVIHVTPYYIYF